MQALMAEAFEDLKEKRAEREIAEKRHQEDLKRAFDEKKRKEQEALDIEIAAIKKKQAEEAKLKDANRDDVIEEARKRLESGFSFSDFSWK
eukprot:m.57210 g.57210  ORF g.57210 m.57210 type:complete len:91 (-) comp49013_c0_seq1:120-392(-)